MKKTRSSVEQIVAVLKQVELGMPVADLIRQVGISEQTFYRWKKQHAGLQSEQVRVTCSPPAVPGRSSKVRHFVENESLRFSGPRITSEQPRPAIGLTTWIHAVARLAIDHQASYAD